MTDPYSFSDSQMTDIRRYCGYPAYGNGATGFQSYLFFQAYGFLEFRMLNLSATEGAVVANYLTTLNTLEAAIPAAGQNLDTDQAAVWHHNRDEVRDRANLYNDWRRRLCGFIGLPPGPDLCGSTGSTIQLLA